MSGYSPSIVIATLRRGVVARARGGWVGHLVLRPFDRRITVNNGHITRHPSLNSIRRITTKNTKSGSLRLCLRYGVLRSCSSGSVLVEINYGIDQPIAASVGIAMVVIEKNPSNLYGQSVSIRNEL